MKRKIILKILCVILLVIFLLPQVALAALTITASSVDDWTALAAATVGESSVIDISGSYNVAIQIQAFLDSTTAHEGTEFIIQTSFNTTGDEDWSDLTQFSALVGTANSEAITNNPLAVGSTTITCADTTGYTMDALEHRWIAIEDGTLANSELCLQSGLTANVNVTVVDGTTNEHVQNTLMYNIAISRTIVIPFGSGSRARVIINNKFDDDGTASSLNYRIRKVLTTAL